MNERSLLVSLSMKDQVLTKCSPNVHEPRGRKKSLHTVGNKLENRFKNLIAHVEIRSESLRYHITDFLYDVTCAGQYTPSHWRIDDRCVATNFYFPYVIHTARNNHTSLLKIVIVVHFFRLKDLVWRLIIISKLFNQHEMYNLDLFLPLYLVS